MPLLRKKEWQMENRKFLKYLPPWLRSIPNLGAFIVGWITIMGWLAWFIGPEISYFKGEGGYVLFFSVFPLMWLGFTAGDLFVRATSWDYASHPTAGKVLIFVLTLTLNMVAVWLTLTLLVAIGRFLRGRLPFDDHEKR